MALRRSADRDETGEDATTMHDGAEDGELFEERREAGVIRKWAKTAKAEAEGQRLRLRCQSWSLESGCGDFELGVVLLLGWASLGWATLETGKRGRGNEACNAERNVETQVSSWPRAVQPCKDRFVVPRKKNKRPERTKTTTKPEPDRGRQQKETNRGQRAVVMGHRERERGKEERSESSSVGAQELDTLKER